MTFDLAYGAVAAVTWILLSHYAPEFVLWERMVFSIATYFISKALAEYFIARALVEKR